MEYKVRPPITDTRARQTWDRQEVFLAGYVKGGNIMSVTSKMPDVGRRAVYRWRDENVNNFVERFENAQQDHCDLMEREIVGRIQEPKSNRGSDILLMFYMKSLRPDKYRESSLQTPDDARRFLKELREFAKGGEREVEVEGESPLAVAEEIVRRGGE